MPMNSKNSEAADRAFFPSVSSTGRPCAVAFEGRLGRAYNQEGFRYLLAIEQARADRSRRPLLLVLISTRTGAGDGIRFAPRVAARVFDALWRCIRDVDMTGWYTQDCVAAAVLIQDHTMPGADGILRIQSRINEALRGRIPPAIAGALRVRVLQMGAAHGDAHPPGQKEPLAMAAAPA